MSERSVQNIRETAVTAVTDQCDVGLGLGTWAEQRGSPTSLEIVGCRSTAGHGVDVNAIEDRREGLRRSELPGRFSCLPPQPALLKQLVRVLAFRVVLLRSGKFFISALDNYACPVELIGNFVDRDTNSRV